MGRDLEPNVELRETQQPSGAGLGTAPVDVRRPAHFGSPQVEYVAATSAAALFDLSDRTQIELSGADRVRFLHSFCTNNVKRLSPGQGCEAFVTNVKGKAVGHVWIDALDSSLWLDADVGSAERLVRHLERYVINEDVAIADRSADGAELLALGPEVAGRLARLGIDVDGLDNLGHRSGQLADASVRVRRFDVGPHRGFAIFAERNRLAACWQSLVEAGLRAAGAEVWTALRIEAGLPLFGVDISDDNLAQEVGRTKTAISFTKGCYLGQEPIARLDALGHVNRELRSLRLAGGNVPVTGSRIFADAAGSAVVGTVTSSAFSFATNSPVAMALLRSNASACGKQVFVEGNPPTEAAVFWYPAN
jgi:folate-binding protein YgfZ